MSTVHRLYRVVEPPHPCDIPTPPVTAVPLPHLLYTDAVYLGPVSDETLIGFVRHEPNEALFVARTRGNAEHAADIRKFAARSAAETWLSKAVNGVMPRVPSVRRFRTYGKSRRTAP